MTDIQYVGEHLWVHYTGHFLVLFAFFSAAFLGIIAYQFYKKNDGDKALWWSWLKIGFLAHTLSILGIISLLLFLGRPGRIFSIMDVLELCAWISYFKTKKYIHSKHHRYPQYRPIGVNEYVIRGILFWLQIRQQSLLIAPTYYGHPVI